MRADNSQPSMVASPRLIVVKASRPSKLINAAEHQKLRSNDIFLNEIFIVRLVPGEVFTYIRSAGVSKPPSYPELVSEVSVGLLPITL